MSDNDISFMGEFNLLMTMPIYWLIAIIFMFMILMNNLSLMNLLVFLIIYSVITRLHLYTDLSSPKLEHDN
jgi:hypothetical protein